MQRVAFALALAFLPASLPAQTAGLDLTEWTVPWPDTRPRDPFAAPDGRVWFVGQVGNYIGVLDPRSGEFRRYELDPGTHPHNLIVAKDGMVWYAGNQNGMIGRLDPATGAIERYPVPDKTVDDPHTLVFDSKGDIWFTAQSSNAVGKLSVATGSFRLVRLPALGSRPYGIVMDSKDRPWFVEFGANRFGTVDPVSFALKEYTLPDPGARARRLVITPDDRIYIGDYVRGTLTRFDPATGRFTEWANPAGKRSAPYAMSGDDRGRVWQVETGPQPNQFVVFDPKTGTFGAPIQIAKSGGRVVRHMSFDLKTRSIWFGTDAGTIGQARVRAVGAGEVTP